jgi:L-ascorbate metabolism protein UlaG (beta-lactamase superfamily)
VSPYLCCATVAALAATGACGLKLPFAHPSLSPYLAYQQRPSSGPVTATFLGTSSLLIRDGMTTVLTDPFVTRPSLTSVAARPIAPDATLIELTLARLGVRKIAAIVASHSHYDHVMDAPTFATQTEAVLLGSSSTANVGRGGNLPEPRIDVVHDGDARRYGAFELTFIESHHSPGDRYPGMIVAPLTPPARVSEWKSGTTWSVLIRHGDRSMLVHGSANVKPGALNGRRADVVFLGIGGLGKQSDEFVEEYWIEIVRATRARRVILIHWDDFFSSLDEPLRPMAYAADSFPDSMRRLLRCAVTDGVEVLLPVAWQIADPFAALSTAVRTVAPTAPHPCREPLRNTPQR